MTPDELQVFMVRVRDAMTAEDITGFYQQRVMNRLLYGHPEGYKPEPGPDEMMPFTLPAHPDAGFAHESVERHLQDLVHPFPVEPQPDAPVFGNDFREIGQTFTPDDTVYPLLSACRCGNQVIRSTPEGSWEHC